MIEDFSFVEIHIKNNNVSVTKIKVPVPKNNLAYTHGTIKDFPFVYREYTQIHTYEILDDLDYLYLNFIFYKCINKILGIKDPIPKKRFFVLVDNNQKKFFEKLEDKLDYSVACGEFYSSYGLEVICFSAGTHFWWSFFKEFERVYTSLINFFS